MTDDETLDERANRLARESIKAIASLHKVKRMAAARNWHCQHCLTMWPCPTISLMQDAEEAISEAEEEQSVYRCGFRTHVASLNGPEEFCENEVEHEGDLCPAHEEPDDDYDYERHRDAKYDDG